MSEGPPAAGKAAVGSRGGRAAGLDILASACPPDTEELLLTTLHVTLAQRLRCKALMLVCERQTQIFTNGTPRGLALQPTRGQGGK